MWYELLGMRLMSPLSACLPRHVCRQTYKWIKEQIAQEGKSANLAEYASSKVRQALTGHGATQQ